MLKRTARAFWPDAVVWTILALAMALSLLLLADGRAQQPAARTAKEILAELAPITQQADELPRSGALAASDRAWSNASVQGARKG
jgi:hypothetical protein